MKLNCLSLGLVDQVDNGTRFANIAKKNKNVLKEFTFNTE